MKTATVARMRRNLVITGGKTEIKKKTNKTGVSPEEVTTNGGVSPPPKKNVFLGTPPNRDRRTLDSDKHTHTERPGHEKKRTVLGLHYAHPS